MGGPSYSLMSVICVVYKFNKSIWNIMFLSNSSLGLVFTGSRDNAKKNQIIIDFQHSKSAVFPKFFKVMI